MSSVCDISSVVVVENGPTNNMIETNPRSPHFVCVCESVVAVVIGQTQLVLCARSSAMDDSLLLMHGPSLFSDVVFKYFVIVSKVLGWGPLFLKI